MLEEEKIEYSGCPMCSGEERSKTLHSFAPYGVVKCLSCGLSYLHPRVTELEIQNLYKNGDYYQGNESGYSDYSLQEQALRATFKKLLYRMKQKKITGTSLLEVGCGYGFLLSEAESYFKYRVGVDFSSDAVVVAKKNADKLFEGGIDAVPKEERFDCIICNQVIEHVYQPLEFVKKLKKYSNKGGKIVLSTPWMNGPLYKIMKKRWPSFKIPEHVVYYDDASLRMLMEKAGLSEIERISYSHAFPLSLIAGKFNVNISGFLGKCNIWVPGTTIAMVGKYNG